jgi:hypothetical protein
MSTKVRDLLKDILDSQKDIYLARIAEARESTFKKSSGFLMTKFGRDQRCADAIQSDRPFGREKG